MFLKYHHLLLYVFWPFLKGKNLLLFFYLLACFLILPLLMIFGAQKIIKSFVL